MRDLNETGQKVIDAIMKRKPSDAGDLALGIEQIIEDLRSNPSQFKEKLDHLEGLFKELAYGEAYELREEVTTPEFEYASGVMMGQQTFNFNNNPPIMVSGSMSMGALSGSIPPGNLIGSNSPPAPAPMANVKNPCGEVPLGESIEDLQKQTMERIKKEEERHRVEAEKAKAIIESKKKPRKEFKKRWWKVQVK